MRQVHGNQTVDAGVLGSLRELLETVAIDRVVITHQHQRGVWHLVSKLFHHLKAVCQGDILLESQEAGLLDNRSLG